MGAGTQPLIVAGVACAYDPDVADADALLERYRVPNVWWDALAEAGAAPVVVQRFCREATVLRGAVEFRLVNDGGPPALSPYRGSLSLVRVVRSLGARAVHVDGLLFPAIVRQLRLALPQTTSVLVQDHGGTADRAPSTWAWPRRLLFAVGLRAADGFLFTSREQTAPWQRAHILGRSQIIHEVAEASSDLATGYDGARGDALPGRPAILTVGRLNANKDPLTALRGYAGSVASLPHSALTMVFTERTLEAEVRGYIAATPALRDRVHLLGPVPRDRLATLYASADLFVLASRSEAASYALLEAMAFGVTPVVSDIPAVRKLTDGGRIGALFAPGDAASLARALGRLGGAGIHTRREVRANFERRLSWEVVARRALDAYRHEPVD